MKVLSVFGTRPEAVKMAPIVRRLKETSGIESRVCVTAQHRQMLDQVLELFQIKPDYDLDLMRENQTMAQISAGIFTHLDPILAELNPDWVLAVGDTTTVVTTSLLAFYRRIKFGHVEAGLRTNNKWHPFPEEINRRLATTTADLHFAPTQWSRRNLLNENVPAASIIVTGNPVIDALIQVSKQDEPKEIKDLLEKLRVRGQGTRGLATRRLILVTAHRRENFGRPLAEICYALKELAGHGDGEIVYPVHLNPNVQEPVNRILRNTPHITLLPPLDYLPMVHLMKCATLILTDSGGLQEEAPAFGIPVLVMRETTERPEGVEAGTLKLVGTETSRIVQEATRLLDDPAAYAEMAKAGNPFGDGHAAERIVEALLKTQVENLEGKRTFWLSIINLMKIVRRFAILFLVPILLMSWGPAYAQSSGEVQYFPETGHNVKGEFLRFYKSVSDPLLLFGYPITEEFKSVDGNTVQYFQRARFELHADLLEGQRATLTSLGKAIYRSGSQQMDINNASACQLFSTGFRVCFAFLDFYKANGGGAQFGKPISPFVFQDNLIVQYFEKARFEWRADRPEGQRVVLSDLGRLYFDQLGENQSQLQPITPFNATINDVLSINARAFVAKAITLASGQQTVYIVVESQTHQAISKATGKATVHFSAGQSADYFFTTNASGVGSIQFNFADQVQGDLVPIDILVTYQGLSARTTTSFRIWY